MGRPSPINSILPIDDDCNIGFNATENELINQRLFSERKSKACFHHLSFPFLTDESRGWRGSEEKARG